MLLVTCYLKLCAQQRALFPIARDWRLEPVEQAGCPELAEEIFVRGGWVDCERGLTRGGVVDGMRICDGRKMRAWGALGMRRM